MGPCQSKENQQEVVESKKIEDGLKDDMQKDAERMKLLLLGAGQSGKSTIFKQLQLIHANGFTKEDRDKFLPIVHGNTVQNMRDLLNGLVKISLILPQDAKAAAQAVHQAQDVKYIDKTLQTSMQTLWTNAVVLEAYERASEFQLDDSAAYFFDKLDVLCAPGYLPDDDDIVRCRVRTTGVSEMTFVMDGVPFHLYDVGGQRSERRKWIHCFDNCTAVVFVAALNEYDQVLFEDDQRNRMDEALAVFEDIANSQHFKETAMILFLNKKDLFEVKIKRVPLNSYFKDFEGGSDLELAMNHVRDQFLARCHDEEKSVYVHCTCATDTNNIRFVFDAVKDVVQSSNLRGSGLF